MNVVVAYVFPTVQRRIYQRKAERFVKTWQEHPPGHPCSLSVYCNGGVAGPVDAATFKSPGASLVYRSNVGWDVGSFQQAAEELPCDLLVCLGAEVHFHREGWLARMVDAYVEHGPGLYGCAAYLSPDWHVRTTAFWLPPELLRAYPWMVGSDRRSRYDFEHGPQSMTRFAMKTGLPCILVTWQGAYPFSQWQDHAPVPVDSLVMDQHLHSP